MVSENEFRARNMTTHLERLNCTDRRNDPVDGTGTGTCLVHCCAPGTGLAAAGVWVELLHG
jgi:hypothetical protein